MARWSVETLNDTVDRELGALPVDMRARFVRISELISAVGLERVREPYVKHLQGPLWEMRMTGRDGTSRALYVTVREKRAIVVRVFIKKTRKTPHSEVRARPATCTGGAPVSKVRDLHQKWNRNPDYRRAYDDLDFEFALARSLIEARVGAGLTQAQLAERMETTQSVVARLESGRGRPSTRTLETFARSTGTRLRIAFEPLRKRPRRS